MTSPVSSEKPKGVTIREIAAALLRTRSGRRQDRCVVGGPAIVHTGSGEHVCQLIRGGYLNVLFAGNALATHDIEQALFGTSLGVRLDRGDCRPRRATSTTCGRSTASAALGGIRPAVETGVLTSGIMYECVKHNVAVRAGRQHPRRRPAAGGDHRRAGGPAADARARSAASTFCLMIATTLHSIAVGNLLPAWVKVACVDINPATVTKLTDRGSFQTVGLVTDVEPFLRALVQELEALAGKKQ